jgi:multicomponent Na+:H+ antiporter subunit C
MIYVNYAVAVLVFALGVFTVLTRRNLVKIVMGLSLMEGSIYVLVISTAYRRGSTAPVLLKPPGGTTERALAHGNVADPVLQNIALTAVIIGVAVTAVLLTTVVRVAQHYRTLDADDVRELRG